MSVIGSQADMEEAKAQSRRAKLLALDAFENSDFWKRKLLPEIQRKLKEQTDICRRLDQPQAIRDGAAGAANEIEKLLGFISQERKTLEKIG